MEMDIQEATLNRFMEAMRPQDPETREQMDYGFTWEENLAVLFYSTPKWDNPPESLKVPFAKIKYTKPAREWKPYWMRANWKWQAYEPFPVATNLHQLLDVIKEDAFGCFFRIN